MAIIILFNTIDGEAKEPPLYSIFIATTHYERVEIWQWKRSFLMYLDAPLPTELGPRTCLYRGSDLWDKAYDDLCVDGRRCTRWTGFEHRVWLGLVVIQVAVELLRALCLLYSMANLWAWSSEGGYISLLLKKEKWIMSLSWREYGYWDFVCLLKERFYEIHL